jgi:hypothetical protein
MKYFFDLPVYRLQEDDYYRQRDADIDKALYPPGASYSEEMRAREKANPQSFVSVRHHLTESYGGGWLFNEIIGYIRLHFLGGQIRGEYYSVDRRRIVKTRTRQFSQLTWKLVAEIEIDQPITDESVFRAVKQYIEDCKRKLPRRYIDTESFDTVAKHVSWRALYLDTRH